MSIQDIRVLDAIIKLHEAAKVVEQDVGIGPLSNDIRACADRLNDMIRAELHTEK
jgi:hypothetical protein